MPSCRRCGRTLTNPASVQRGMGSTCAKKSGYMARNTQSQQPSAISGTPRVFISFHIDDKGAVELLRYQAKESGKLEFIDYSVKEPFDEKWKTNCTDRINQSSILVVAIGKETYSRDAVLWEINKAYELGKPVFGMRVHRDQSNRIPQPLTEHNADILDWNLDALQAKLDAIKQESQEQAAAPPPRRQRRRTRNYAYA